MKNRISAVYHWRTQFNNIMNTEPRAWTRVPTRCRSVRRRSRNQPVNRQKTVLKVHHFTKGPRCFPTVCADPNRTSINHANPECIARRENDGSWKSKTPIKNLSVLRWSTSRTKRWTTPQSPVRRQNNPAWSRGRVSLVPGHFIGHFRNNETVWRNVNTPDYWQSGEAVQSEARCRVTAGQNTGWVEWSQHLDRCTSVQKCKSSYRLTEKLMKLQLTAD